MSTEARLTATIVRELKRRKIWHAKIHGGPHQRAGLPDLLVIVNGRAGWFEVKTLCGKLTPLQEAMLRRLRDAGCYAGVVRSIEGFEKQLEVFLKSCSESF